MPAFDLCPATPADQGFLFELYVHTRQAEFAALGWPPAALQAFLHQQWEARSASYRHRFAQAADLIVQHAGQRAGRVLLHTQPGRLHVVDLALLPALQGRGLGTAVLRGVQQRAAAQGRGVSLQVARDNPAARLYHRLGFEITEACDLHLAMHWPPPCRPHRPAETAHLLETPA